MANDRNTNSQNVNREQKNDSIHVSADQNRRVNEHLSFSRPKKPMRASESANKGNQNDSNASMQQISRRPVLDETKRVQVEAPSQQPTRPVKPSLSESKQNNEDLEKTNSTPAIRTANYNNLVDIGETRRTRLVRAQDKSVDDLLMKREEAIAAERPVKITANPIEDTSKNKKAKVLISAKNRKQEEMDAIIKNEARMTEIPGGKLIVPGLSRLARTSASKKYRLKGYCNEAYVEKQRKNKLKKVRLWNWIFWIIIIILLLVLFYWLDPIDKIQNLLHLFGM